MANKNEIKEEVIKKELSPLEEMKLKLNKNLALLAKGGLEKTDTKMILTRNLLKLNEMKTKNSYMFQKILESSNRDTTALMIINNTINGLLLNEDFYLVAFGGDSNSIVEIKTGRAWRKLAMQYSVKKIKSINAVVLSNKDTYTTSGFPARLTDLKLDFNVDKSKFDNIRGAYAEVNYEDGTHSTRILTIDEIKQMRGMSPSMKDAKKSAYSPWSKFPFKMVESKILRDLITREIDLDKKKMAKDGYTVLEDETPVKAQIKENVLDITNDFEELEKHIQKENEESVSNDDEQEVQEQDEDLQDFDLIDN